MINSFFKRRAMARLAALRYGRLELLEAGESHSFGDLTSQLHAVIRVHRDRFFRRAALGGGIGIADSLADGDWSCSDLTALIRIFILNLQQSDSLNGGWSTLRQGLEKWMHFLRRNTVSNSKRNIVKHYDLSNEFFALFLDPTMSYSSAIFTPADISLDEAAVTKMDRVCQLLNLRPSDHLLEIGTGWGGLAIHAAKHYGCQVTTTTISDRQYEEAKRRVARAGLTQQIELLRHDYRQLDGQYDKIASIEMIEAVGHQFFDTYFRKCASLLKPRGEMLIQAITIVDHRFEHHKRSVDFIKRFIFPGGCLPSLTALMQSVSRTSRLRLVHLDDFASHYAKTLRCWRDRFMNRLDEVRKLGFDDSFIRLWEYYLCYCEAAFLERHVNVAQMLFANHQSKIDASSRAKGRQRPKLGLELENESMVAAGSPNSIEETVS